MADLREIEPGELAEILEQHRLWVRSGQREGTQANLTRVNLQGVDLRRANLQGAELRHVNFIEADLRQANFREADLTAADLSRAKLCGSCFVEARLRGGKLAGANLSNAVLAEVDLQGANLSGAELHKAKLSGASLIKAKLTRANLNEVQLRMGRLHGAKLTGANLHKVDFSWAALVSADFSNADLTGVGFYASNLTHWKIDGIKCQYCYWDGVGKQRTPPDRDFKAGEFEALYKSLPVFEYFFTGGMTPLDPVIMDRVTQAIRQREPELDIKIKSIEAGGFTPSIKFTIVHEDRKAEAEDLVAQEYERHANSLELQAECVRGLLASNQELLQKYHELAMQPRYLQQNTGGHINAPMSGDVNVTFQAAVTDLQKAVEQEQPDAKKGFGQLVKEGALGSLGRIVTTIKEGKETEAKELTKSLLVELEPLLRRGGQAALAAAKLGELVG